MPSRKHFFRGALHEAEALIPKGERNQMAEWERDLFATAACAVWENDLKRLVRCVRKLAQWGEPMRRAKWESLYFSICSLLTLSGSSRITGS